MLAVARGALNVACCLVLFAVSCASLCASCCVFVLLVVECLLFAVRCVSLVAVCRSLLCVVQCVLAGVRWLRRVLCRALPDVCYVLFVGCCFNFLVVLLFAVRSVVGVG